jgi:hypothetical protein
MEEFDPPLETPPDWREALVKRKQQMRPLLGLVENRPFDVPNPDWDIILQIHVEASDKNYKRLISVAKTVIDQWEWTHPAYQTRKVPHGRLQALYCLWYSQPVLADENPLFYLESWDLSNAALRPTESNWNRASAIIRQHLFYYRQAPSPPLDPKNWYTGGDWWEYVVGDWGVCWGYWLADERRLEAFTCSCGNPVWSLTLAFDRVADRRLGSASIRRFKGQMRPHPERCQHHEAFMYEVRVTMECDLQAGYVKWKLNLASPNFGGSIEAWCLQPFIGRTPVSGIRTLTHDEEEPTRFGTIALWPENWDGCSAAS